MLGSPGRAYRSLDRGDKVALVIIAAIPVLAFAVPAALGHPVLPGDDATQNFPLRVLVGRQIRGGHLPVLDMQIWSGAPLLAGWNAGAAYPFTWLFAVLPASAAWAANLVLTYWTAGVGLYAFLRASRLSSFAAALGALTFSFAGAMDAQIVHFGLVAGVSFVPLQLLAVLMLARAEDGRTRAIWCGWLAVFLAMTLLAGEPRAIDVAAFVTGPYAIWRLARAPGRRSRLVAYGALAGVLALAIGSLQLLPGLHALAQSQRAPKGFDFQLYDSGSYPWSWLLLLFEPNLLGGSGSFGAPQFLGNYNLTEVTAYVGILPWVGAFALLAVLSNSVRRRRGVPEWAVWELLAALGLILALGGNTPAWHILIKIPLFGSQRLQNRNILVTDLAVAVLFAYWLERLTDGASRVETSQMHPNTTERLAGAIAGLGAMATGLMSIIWGAGMLRWLGVAPGLAAQDGGLRPWFVPTVAVGALALAVALFAYRMSPRARRTVVSVVFALDLGLFGLTSLFLVDGASGPPGPPHGPTRPADALGIPGRFGVYDPALLHGPSLAEAGAPDQNILVGGSSFQGYSAIVGAKYAKETGAHKLMGGGQDILSPKALASTVLDQLDPGPLLTLPEYLMVRESKAASLVSSGAYTAPVPSAGSRKIRPAGAARWYFGEPLKVMSLRLALSRNLSSTKVGLVLPDGAVSWLDTNGAVWSPEPLHRRRGAYPYELSLDAAPGAPGQAMTAVGVVISAGRELGVGVPTVVTATGRHYELDGVLQAALSGGQWSYRGMDGPFSVFAARHPSPPLMVEPFGGRVGVQASVHRLEGPVSAPTSAEVYSLDGALVVRSVAYMPGWYATWKPLRADEPARHARRVRGGEQRPRAGAASESTPSSGAPSSGTPSRSRSGGATIKLAVREHGLVQAVTVPAGEGILTWHYAAPGLRSAEILAALGLIGVLALLFLGKTRPRREEADAGSPQAARPT